MSREILKPLTRSAPAKVKDSGVIDLVKAGAAAYNAKSGELLLLPVGLEAVRALIRRVERRLFDDFGIQPVNCGNDAAIFSLAERYTREWGDSAISYCDERGRELRLLSWRLSADSAAGEAAAALAAIVDELGRVAGGGGEKFAAAEEILPGNIRSFSLLSLSDAGSIGARPGFVCSDCGKVLLPDSPLGFFVKQPGEGEPEEELRDIETPGANTITELCSQLGIEAKRTLKAMLYVAEENAGARRAVAAFVRGDFNVSMNKLERYIKSACGLSGLRTAEKPELYELVGEVAGYCGPIGLPEDVIVVCDRSAIGAKNVIAGANRPGYHRAGCCHGRDFCPPEADIAQCAPGASCSCGGAFEPAALRESGTITAGAAPSAERRLSYRDRDGNHEYPFEWGGAVSVERILLAAGLERTDHAM
ncbi:MAG: hypothetical protein LBS93_01525 [Synergistaceae bacterium]|jgi:prolyl-tRNA synthetase|nr:hypothetical protein [Synergistaceae bacterium]